MLLAVSRNRHPIVYWKTAGRRPPMGGVWSNVLAFPIVRVYIRHIVAPPPRSREGLLRGLTKQT